MARELTIYRGGVTWKRCEGEALADAALGDDARDAQLEDYLRMRNPHLTDIRLERATPRENSGSCVAPARRWYRVTYLAND